MTRKIMGPPKKAPANNPGKSAALRIVPGRPHAGANPDEMTVAKSLTADIFPKSQADWWPCLQEVRGKRSG